MRPMAAIPESTRNSITLRLLDHAEAHWPQLTRVKVTYRGSDRKSTRLTSSHSQISYAVFCLKAQNIFHSSYQVAQGLYGMGFGPAPATSLGDTPPECAPPLPTELPIRALDCGLRPTRPLDDT